MRYFHLCLAMGLLCVGATSTVLAHDGRRFAVVIDDGQLAARGYISTDPAANDQGGNPRPYFNALHDHWDNISTVATTDLPGFGVLPVDEAAEHGVASSAAALAGSDLTLTLVGAYKWTTPSAGGSVSLEPLGGADPTISIALSGSLQPAIDTATYATTGPNALLLATSIDDASGAPDLDLQYEIETNPIGIIYALEWVLSATTPGIADSGSIYTLLSPDPDPTDSGMPNPMVGLHHASLHLEQHLGVAIVPEPSSCLILWLFGGMAIGAFRGPKLRADNVFLCRRFRICQP